MGKLNISFPSKRLFPYEAYGPRGNAELQVLIQAQTAG
jgi:hypothetical protein